jgi:hypothetical protein
MRSILTERVKVILLLACFFLSLATLFTSSSFEMGGRDLPVLRPNIVQYCQVQLTQAAACAGNSSNECTATERKLKLCQLAVQRAYRRINLGGCPFQIQQKTLCENEWCSRGSKKNLCDEECTQVRSQLSSCVEGVVHSCLEGAGLLTAET